MSYDLMINARAGARADWGLAARLTEQLSAVAGVEAYAGTEEDAAFSAKLALEDDLALGGGEIDWASFDAMCAELGLPGRAGATVSPEAALAWLVRTGGVPLVTVALPRDEPEVRNAFRIIVQQAKAHGLVVVDPQAGTAIDLDAPPELPPMW